MKTQLIHLFEILRGSLWLIPTLFAILSAALSVFAAWFDNSATGGLPALYEFQPRSADSIRTLFATIASSMLGIAGVSFSITVVAFSLASSQFGPRLLRIFIRDTHNQTVLGIQLGVFIFCIIQIALLREDLSGDFSSPLLGSLLSLLLAIAGLGSFIHFIHHIASSMQAENVIRKVYAELLPRMDQFFPKEGDSVNPGKPSEWLENGEDADAIQFINAAESGYIQAFKIEEITALSTKWDCRVVTLLHPGSYIIKGAEIFAVLRDNKLDDADVAKLTECCLTGVSRSLEQDFEFAIHQLVEIAVRALSPGVNDPFTAISCIDYLGSVYARISKR